jgi:hypothetical protein
MFSVRERSFSGVPETFSAREKVFSDVPETFSGAPET